MQRDTKIIAVSGKGGVGKTTLSAAVVRTLTECYPEARILAIDADPAIGLSTALSVEVRRTLDDIRKSIVNKTEAGETKQAIELLNEARFRIFDTMVENQSFAFIAIGRPETAGCYCAINTYLKEVISMLAGDFDYVVIDGEAGIEQINRRVMEKVTHLLLISDQSRKGIQVVKTVKQVSDELVMADRVGLIINRVTNPELCGSIAVDGVEDVTFIASDPEQAENDILGKSVFELAEDSAVLKGIRLALEKMEIIQCDCET